MKKIFIFLVLSFPGFVFSQNVGIGTDNPQNKLHVAGGVTIDGLGGAKGIITHDALGVLGSVPYTYNNADFLKGDGTWGSVNGTVPSGAIVATENYNDPNLISKGFTLYGSIPGFSKYVSSSFVAAPGTWAVTYYKGNVSKYTPPFFDSYDLIVWADTVLYVFANNALYAYNPERDSWRFVFFNATSYRASPNSKALWTGTEILVYGGNYTTAVNNGFRYNPGTNVWTAIPTTNQPAARSDFAMHLVNNRLVIWGGLTIDRTTLLNTGGMLNLTTNTWTTMSIVNAPSARYNFTSVGTSLNTMIVWGGWTSLLLRAPSGNGAVFNPVTNSWVAMSITGAPEARHLHTAVWSGTEMIVYGGGTGIGGSAYLNTGGKYNPVSNTWTAINISGAAPGRTNPSSVWTGTNMLISGGATGGYSTPPGSPFASDSYLYNPVTNSWSNSSGMGLQKSNHLSIKADNNIIVFGGGTTILNTATGTYTFYGGYPQGSRYFLASIPTSKTEILKPNDGLYLYIKQ